jgi:predicted transcriptional regulator
MSSTTVTVRLTPELKAALGRLAEATDRTRSYLAGEAIADFVARELAIVEGIRRGIDDATREDLVPHEVAMKRLRSTIAKGRKST